ncbi:MAG: heavy metal translocating P-type ATPase metal-binding domain-containing protein [Lewinellaceae bacterium]|nr:heavy metal translocating P-type ATPase metal-binding domain-containing protein [Lewinellaceae bacterium]
MDDKAFCCEGCGTVFEILDDNGLCRYYELDENAGVSLRGKAREEYAFLDDPDVREKIIDFSDTHRTRVTFFIPQIHCASCIWLLENLYKLSPGVLASTVNFVKKEAYITFSEEDTSLRKVVELLTSIGYARTINLSNLDREDKPLVTGLSITNWASPALPLATSCCSASRNTSVPGPRRRRLLLPRIRVPEHPTGTCRWCSTAGATTCNRYLAGYATRHPQH